MRHPRSYEEIAAMRLSREWDRRIAQAAHVFGIKHTALEYGLERSTVKALNGIAAQREEREDA